jgi:cell division protein FtsZ
LEFPEEDMIEIVDEDVGTGARIKVIGVGGAGGNAINTMIAAGLTGVEFIAMNTDAQDLRRSLAPRRFQLGAQLTKGLGAGANPEVGREAALEDRDRIAELVVGADMVFITAGMGGGTGTGAAPIIAQVARECGALTVAVCTRPFSFEGKRRRRQAQEGIEALQHNVDTLITIPNQRLISMANDRTSMKDAFRMADEVLLQAVKGVADLINYQGEVNVDFADVRTIMSGKGVALMGVGVASGDHKTVEAAQRAISSPLLDEVSMVGATSVLINLTGGRDLTLYEAHEALTLIQEEAHEDAQVIFGWVIDDSLKDEVRVTVIATGFEEARQISNVQSVERRVNERVIPSAMSSGRRPMRGRELHSGIDRMHDDYDIPTFFKNAD